MKIAFHFPSLAGGGMERVCINLAREFVSRGHDVDFVLCSTKGELASLVPKGVRIHNLKAKRTRHSLLPIVSYLKYNKPDSFIANLGPQNVLSIMAKIIAGNTGTRFYLAQHNQLSRQAKKSDSIQIKLIPILYRWALPRADGVIAVSEGVAADMARVTGFKKSNIEVIYNPAYLEGSFASRPRRYNRPYVVAVGRLVHAKGFDDLIRSFSMIAPIYQDLDLVILGEGPLRDDLDKLISDLNLKGRVNLIGFVEDPREYIAHAELFVLSSRFEGFGNVIVEALSFGIPVVSTNCESGPSEILKNGEYGILVPVGDNGAMAEAMKKSLSNEHDRSKLILRAKDFTSEKIADKYLSLMMRDSR